MILHRQIHTGLLTWCLFSFTTTAQEQVMWNLASLMDTIAPPFAKTGNPGIIEIPGGRAVSFNGAEDGLFMDENPLATLPQFTVEVLFRPDPDGLPAQRFLHMGEMSRDRVMLETRLTKENMWYLDAHVRSGDSALTLIDSTKLHATGQWYHVAFVVEDGHMETFVNGMPELRGGIPFKAFKGGKTSLGVRQNHVHWFKGAIAVIRISPMCLQPSEFVKTGFE